MVHVHSQFHQDDHGHSSESSVGETGQIDRRMACIYASCELPGLVEPQAAGGGQMLCHRNAQKDAFKKKG